MSKKTKKQKPIKRSRNETARIRYQMLREAGYTVDEARKLRYQKLDVSDVKIKDGNIIKNRKYQQILKTLKVENKYSNYNQEMNKVKNDTVYSRWGMLTQDKRYKNKTAEVVQFIKKDMKLKDDQAYYVLWFMHTNNLSYRQTKEQFKTDKNFERYRKVKKGKKK